MSRFDANRKAKRNKAVALRYKVDEDAAPVVVASGYGQIADKIVGIAEEKGIPVFKDDSAASMLCMLEIGRSIPPDLYEVIAAIYMQILTVSKKIKGESANDVNPSIISEDIQRVLDNAQQNRK